MCGNTILVAGNSNDALPFFLTTNKESLSLYLLDKLYSLCGGFLLSDYFTKTQMYYYDSKA